jgi:hypothetical protein
MNIMALSKLFLEELIDDIDAATGRPVIQDNVGVKNGRVNRNDIG